MAVDHNVRKFARTLCECGWRDCALQRNSTESQHIRTCEIRTATPKKETGKQGWTSFPINMATMHYVAFFPRQKLSCAAVTRVTGVVLAPGILTGRRATRQLLTPIGEENKPRTCISGGRSANPRGYICCRLGHDVLSKVSPIKTK